ncbi:MAG TPA: MFS transporter [Microbacterium sp.]|nr:MFS transporter [Microbacterium sp.]
MTDDGVVAGPDAASTGAEDRPHWRRHIVLFLGGQTITLFGSMLVQYAVMWHIVLETGSGGMMALVAVFGFLPQAIVSVFAGVWADRHNRKYLIMGADGAIAVSTLVLALVLMAGYYELWLIFLTLAIRSVGAGIQTPAVSAFIPQIVPTDKLMRVNGVNGAIQSGMMLLAPAAAGALYVAASLVAIFWVDVVTAAIGIAILATISVPPLIRTFAGERPSYSADLREGVRYVAGHAFVRWFLVLFAIVFVLTVAPSYLTPLMIERSFSTGVADTDAWLLTLLEISFSIGMVVGGLVIAVWGGMKDRITMIIVSSLAFGAISIGLGLSPNVWVFYGFMLICGLAVPFFSTPSMTILQETVEPERQGRVFGFVGIVMAVAMPVGMLVFGPLADLVPVEWVLISAGILTFVVVALAVWLPSGRRAVAAAHAASSRSGTTGAEASAAAFAAGDAAPGESLAESDEPDEDAKARR